MFYTFVIPFYISDKSSKGKSEDIAEKECVTDDETEFPISNASPPRTRSSKTYDRNVRRQDKNNETKQDKKTEMKQEKKAETKVCKFIVFVLESTFV